jgi:hypothetical protein
VICPNCKTELVEVNGRYICSDCGREIPENEVMASDWGNGGITRAGLYGAGTDEPVQDGAQAVTDYSASLSESENEIKAPEAAVEPTQDQPAELSVEEILQQQKSASSDATEEPVAAEVAIPEIPAADTGFYTAPPVEPTPVVIPAQEPESSSGSFVPTQDDGVVALEPEVEPTAVVESEPVVEPAPDLSSLAVSQGPSPEVQDSLLQGNDNVIEPVPVVVSAQEPEALIETPIVSSEPTNESLPASVIPTQTFQDIIPPAVTPEVQPMPVTTSEIVPDVAPEISQEVIPDVAPGEIPPHSTEVKDLFEDPAIYSDPSYDTGVAPEQTEAPDPNVNLPMAGDKRANLIILISGAVLVLIMLIGGIWAYVALNKPTAPVAPVVEEPAVTWQDLQPEAAGFTISMPGEAENTEGTANINAVSTNTANHTYATDDGTYSVITATLTPDQAKAITDNLPTALPAMVAELAAPENLTVGSTKIGKYYAADAIDFKLTNDTAIYQGKLIIKGDKYFVVMAGSPSGQAVEYDKFIKSFKFVTTESTS